MEGRYQQGGASAMHPTNWLISIGTRPVRDGLRNLVDRTDRRAPSIFQIGLRFIERCVINVLSYRFLLFLSLIPNCQVASKYLS